MNYGYVTPPYYGGANTNRPGSKGNWIISLLPYEKDSCYVEPFAGMLGVLLGRPRSDVEIASDLHGRVVNWWKCVRDHTDELLFKLAFQPHAESVFYEYRASIDEGDPVDRAAKFYLMVSYSRIKGDGHPTFAVYTEPRGRLLTLTDRLMAGLHDLADRMRSVQFLNRDAADILERIAVQSKAIVYADPPYISANTTPYGADSLDIPRLTEAFHAQRGRVAISGFNDDWDHLGWERHTFDTYTNMGDANAPNRNTKRTEVLWTNYPAGSQLEMFNDETT